MPWCVKNQILFYWHTCSTFACSSYTAMQLDQVDTKMALFYRITSTPNACTHAFAEIKYSFVLCLILGNKISASAGHAMIDERMLHGCTYVDLHAYYTQIHYPHLKAYQQNYWDITVCAQAEWQATCYTLVAGLWDDKRGFSRINFSIVPWNYILCLIILEWNEYELWQHEIIKLCTEKLTM